MDAPGKKVETDQRIDIELSSFQFGKEVGPARDEHCMRAELGRHARSFTRRLRAQVSKSRQAQQGLVPWVAVRLLSTPGTGCREIPAAHTEPARLCPGGAAPPRFSRA